MNAFCLVSKLYCSLPRCLPPLYEQQVISVKTSHYKTVIVNFCLRLTIFLWEICTKSFMLDLEPPSSWNARNVSVLPWRWRWWRWGRRCRPAAGGTTGSRCGHLCRTEFRCPGTRRRPRKSLCLSSPCPPRRDVLWRRCRRFPPSWRSYRTAGDSAETMDADSGHQGHHGQSESADGRSRSRK